MKRGWAALGLAFALLWPASALAAGPARSASLELLVLLPQKHALAVFEQVEMSPAALDPPIGLLQGFRNFAPINVSVLGRQGDTVTVRGRPSTIAVKYDLPWDGTSTLLQETLPVKTASVVIMVPES